MRGNDYLDKLYRETNKVVAHNVSQRNPGVCDDDNWTEGKLKIEEYFSSTLGLRRFKDVKLCLEEFAAIIPACQCRTSSEITYEQAMGAILGQTISDYFFVERQAVG